MAFITAADLKAKVLELLGKDAFPAEEDARWTNIIADSVSAGYQEIVSALVGRGLTIAQVNTWDRGVEFNTDLGLFWAFVKRGVPNDFDETFIMLLDRRAELLTVTLTAGGEEIEPEIDASRPRVKSGVLKNPKDVFSMDSKW